MSLGWWILLVLLTALTLGWISVFIYYARHPGEYFDSYLMDGD